MEALQKIKRATHQEPNPRGWSNTRRTRATSNIWTISQTTSTISKGGNHQAR
jgi:hypothetical protein